VHDDDLACEWDAFASEWIARCEEHRDNAREGLLDEWMLGVVGDVRGKRVIDLGCGEGRFCRMLAERGASTVGIDLQPTFIDYANGRRGSAEEYHLGDIQDLSGWPSSSFDVAVSYITLVDVPDERATIDEAFRLLRSGGRFIVCTVSPMASAWMVDGPWCEHSSTGEPHYVLDSYTDEGPRRVVWRSGHAVTNFHRTLSTMVNDFLDAGFTLVRLHEPVPNEAQLAKFPENRDLGRVPIFMILDLAKP
jgi:ubiquinone/menaquinone biosynthesis C-methylase UbiE